jgi:phospholipid/cholesterol/gamma-HCH transport system ATP-binding protein
MSPGPPIRLEHVTHQFGAAVVLREISLTVQRGEVAVVIGGSGTGKTTLLRIIVGLLRPSAGHVRIDGEDIARLKARELERVRAKFGVVFQYSALLDSLNVLDNVALPLHEHTQLGQAEIRERVRAKLAALGLSEAEDKLPGELSGGMRKRVGLARALIREPSMILYDEPSSGLDPITARLVDDLILRTRDQFGVTSLVISHDMAQALKVGDHLLLLDHGRLVADGRPRELVREPGSLAAQFFEASGVADPTLMQDR